MDTNSLTFDEQRKRYQTEIESKHRVVLQNGWESPKHN